MYYSQDIIDEVCRRNDIVDVVSSHVKLTRRGSNYFGLCPFHSEKSPSFSVSPSKQMYHCFGCGAGGSVITFTMNIENYSFPEAVEALADRAGIELPKQSASSEEKEKDSLRSRLLAVNKEAGKYYYYLLRHERGRNAYGYLTGRGLTDPVINAFGLGYAGFGKENLYGYLKKQGYEDELLGQSGLFNHDEKRGMLDKFWNRVIFPIMDIQNRIIGFGGRVMGEGTPKYLNSPETTVFEKGRNLYGLNLARTARKKSLIICEGYMDVISMHQAGFKETVASLGTALTVAQANLMKRYADEVFVCYDSDAAGIKAALRAIPILRNAGFKCRVINMNPYKDPDEFIKNLGSSEFEKRMEEAENSFYYEVRIDEASFDLKDPDDKTRFFKNIAARLLRFEDAIERDNYLEGIADKYHISPESLGEMVKKQAMKAENINVYERPKSLDHKTEREDGRIKAQKGMLTWLCEEPGIYTKIKEYIKTEDFSEGLLKDLATRIYEQLENGSINPAAIISSYEEEEMQRQVASVFNEEVIDTDIGEDRDKALKELILRLLKDSWLSPGREEDNGDVMLIQERINKKKEYERIKSELKNIRLLN
ncbi:MAG: DNA primase [Lachnospiraceae bacterium]|nr:DNA primase [Lachnospiraceae bacterium]